MKRLWLILSVISIVSAQPELFKKALKQQVERKINFVRPAPILENYYYSIFRLEELEVKNNRWTNKEIKGFYKARRDIGAKYELGEYDYKLIIEQYDENDMPLTTIRLVLTVNLFKGEIYYFSTKLNKETKSYNIRFPYKKMKYYNTKYSISTVSSGA